MLLPEVGCTTFLFVEVDGDEMPKKLVLLCQLGSQTDLEMGYAKWQWWMG